MPVQTDVAVIGGGQAALTTGFYLRRAGLTPGDDFAIIDASTGPGGAWSRMWDGLRLFSPSSYSSLPGWMMPSWNDSAGGFPPARHVVDYLTAYESRYDLAPWRPFRVEAVRRQHREDRHHHLVHRVPPRAATPHTPGPARPVGANRDCRSRRHQIAP